MTISKATLRANVFADIYSVLNSQVTDPKSRGKQWIFSSLPNIDEIDKIGYPILVVGKALINKDYELFDNSFADNRTPIRITIYSTSNAIVDTLTDSVDEVMTPSNLPQFGFYDYDETEGDIALGGDTAHYRLMTYFVDVDNIE